MIINAVYSTILLNHGVLLGLILIAAVEKRHSGISIQDTRVCGRLRITRIKDTTCKKLYTEHYIEYEYRAYNLLY